MVGNAGQPISSAWISSSSALRPGSLAGSAGEMRVSTEAIASGWSAVPSIIEAVRLDIGRKVADDNGHGPPAARPEHGARSGALGEDGDGCDGGRRSEFARREPAAASEGEQNTEGEVRIMWALRGAPHTISPSIEAHYGALAPQLRTKHGCVGGRGPAHRRWHIPHGLVAAAAATVAPP